MRVEFWIEKNEGVDGWINVEVCEDELTAIRSLQSIYELVDYRDEREYFQIRKVYVM